MLKKPIAAVSVLEALAVSSGATGKVLALLDAGRQEAFLGEYKVRDGSAVKIRESLLTQEELPAFVKSSGEVTVVTSDEAIAKRVGARRVARPQSDSIARLALKKILSGQTVSPEELDANYIRRSDAEIFARP